MTASAAVKTAPAVKAPAEARLPASGESSGYASVIQTAESSGVRTGLAMGRGEPVLWGGAARSSPMKAIATIESTSASIEAIAINENSAVRLVDIRRLPKAPRICGEQSVRSGHRQAEIASVSGHARWSHGHAISTSSLPARPVDRLHAAFQRGASE
jgi:hypothetical protein